MSTKRLTFTAIFCHFLILLPLLLYFFSLLFHWYTPEINDILSLMELVCIIAAIIIVFFSIKSDTSFLSVWVPMVLSTAGYAVLAVLLHIFSFVLIVRQFGAAAVWDAEYGAPMVIHLLIPQCYYYLAGGFLFGLIGALGLLFKEFHPKISKFYRKFIWVGFFLGNLTPVTAFLFVWIAFTANYTFFI